MLFEDFVQSAIVVDNIDSEMTPLASMLVERDIRVDSFVYGKDDLKTFHRNRQLIFIDLMLNENAGQQSENISLVINALSKLCAEDFGLYGLVVWTKHPKEVKELMDGISKAAFQTSKEDADDDEEENNLDHSGDNGILLSRAAFPSVELHPGDGGHEEGTVRRVGESRTEPGFAQLGIQ